ncbi:MAG: alpha/beta hydrolase [Rhizobiales bacterium]|nr:alpha/beta hydrolase [Hyphomicrobiales bacterium]
MITFLVLLALLAAGIVGLAIWSRMRASALEFRFERAGRDVEVDGGTLNVLSLGDTRSEGPPIVLVHGAGANLMDLKVSIGDRLAQDRRVVLIDRPGHGWSDRIDREDIATPEGQAIAISQALAKLGIEKPLIVGHDWGGTLALSYALSFPEEIAGIVTIAPISHPSPGGLSLVHRLCAARYTGRIASEILAPLLGPARQSMMLRRSFSPQSVTGDYLDAVGTPLALRPASFLANAQDMVALDGFLSDQSVYYSQISVPLVILTGDLDSVTSPSRHAERLANDVHNSRIVILNDVGHMAHHSSPNVIAFEINRLAENL